MKIVILTIYYGTVTDKIAAVVGSIFTFIFSNVWISLIFYILLINSIAIFLMKKDKAYAKEEKRRIRESTLLIVALAGGAVRNVLCNV